MTSLQKFRADDPAGRQLFKRRLLTWYQRNKRPLPWRKDRDPYRVWLSEIMLQQTRVAAVIAHYQRFLELFPSVEKLAAAREASVLAAWSGLGYYRRARMLHAAAKQLVNEHGGQWPTNAAALRQLPGIGRYTAAAIASIAFDEPIAVVDGNVERVLHRVTGKPLAGEALWQAANQLLAASHPGDSNQAMMELGAMVCVPKTPDCPSCPVLGFCATRGAGVARQKEVRRKREIRYALNCKSKSVFLVRRAKSEALMPGMWELPEVSADDQQSPWMTMRHSITVTDYSVGIVKDTTALNVPGKWIATPKVNALPLTGLTRKVLKAAGIV
jgi:A/G-specific adenine glycosylase